MSRFASTLEVSWPQKDVDALFRQLQRAQKELGRTLGQAVRTAAGAVARSLSASSRMSNKKRPFSKTDEKLLVKMKNGGKFLSEHTWQVDREPGVPPHFKEMRFIAKGKAAANRHKKVKIAYSGLAKQAWRQSAVRAGARIAGGGSNASRVRRVAAANSIMQARFKGDDPFARLNNYLSYAVSALQGGPKDVDTAMERAAAGMGDIIDKEIARKLGVA